MGSLNLRVLLVGSLVLIATPTNSFAAIQTLNGLSGQNQTFQNDSNVTISSANRVHTIGWQGLLDISRGGTGASSFTAGSVLFSDGSTITQDNLNLFWDNANNRLGIGTSSPTVTLDVSGNAKVSGNLDVTGNITAANLNLSNLVPYTGATGNVDLGSHNLTATSLTSTADSIINGLTVGLGGGAFQGNTVLGKNALVNNNTGARNVAVGEGALFATNTSDNTAVGQSALHSVSNTGDKNTAVGSQALQANTSGSVNSAFGYASLQFDTTGDSNTSIGVKALQFNTTGSRNVALGLDALSNNTTGGSNIAIGNGTQANQVNDINSIMLGDSVVGAGTNTAVIGNSSMTDVFFGSSASLANTHAKKLFLGSSSIPGCIIMGDSGGGAVTYVTANAGVLTASTTPPSACQ